MWQMQTFRNLTSVRRYRLFRDMSYLLCSDMTNGWERQTWVVKTLTLWEQFVRSSPYSAWKINIYMKEISFANLPPLKIVIMFSSRMIILDCNFINEFILTTFTTFFFFFVIDEYLILTVKVIMFDLTLIVGKLKKH